MTVQQRSRKERALDMLKNAKYANRKNRELTEKTWSANRDKQIEILNKKLS